MTTIPASIKSFKSTPGRPLSGKPMIPWERLGRVTAPVLVLHATKSGQTKEQNSDIASKLHKNDGTKKNESKYVPSSQVAKCPMASPIGNGVWRNRTITDRVLKYQQELQGAKAMTRFLYGQAHDKLAHRCAEKLERCADFLEFTEYKDGTSRLTNARFCGLFFLCPVCARRRARRLAAKYASIIQQARTEHPNARLYFSTLTISASKDLFSGVAHLTTSVRTFLNHGKEARRGKLIGSPEAANVIGAVQAIELCGDQSNLPEQPKLWTPHSHAVWLCDRAPDPVNLRREWRAVTQDSYDVHVRPLSAYNLPAHAPALEAAIQSDTFRVLMYPQKVVQLPVPLRWKVFSMFRNSKKKMRLLSSHGAFYGRKSSDEPLPKPHLVARYTLSGYKYDVLDAELLDDDA